MHFYGRALSAETCRTTRALLIQLTRRISDAGVYRVYEEGVATSRCDEDGSRESENSCFRIVWVDSKQ